MLTAFLIGVIIALGIHLYIVHRRVALVERDLHALQSALVNAGERLKQP